MRVALVWTVLVIALGVFIAMLVGVWRHRAHATTAAQPNALASEYAWATVPWIIMALCVTPAVRQVLAAERSDSTREHTFSAERHSGSPLRGMENAKVAPHAPSFGSAHSRP